MSVTNYIDRELIEDASLKRIFSEFNNHLKNILSKDEYKIQFEENRSYLFHKLTYLKKKVENLELKIDKDKLLQTIEYYYNKVINTSYSYDPWMNKNKREPKNIDGNSEKKELYRLLKKLKPVYFIIYKSNENTLDTSSCNSSNDEEFDPKFTEAKKICDDLQIKTNDLTSLSSLYILSNYQYEGKIGYRLLNHKRKIDIWYCDNIPNFDIISTNASYNSTNSVIQLELNDGGILSKENTLENNQFNDLESCYSKSSFLKISNSNGCSPYYQNLNP